MTPLRFSVFDQIPNFHHAVTTREGGVSQGAFASLNLAFHVNDAEKAVRENRRLLAEELDFPLEDLTCAQQVHGDRVQLISKNEVGSGALDWASAISGTDALITAQKEVPLLILVADCAPILIVDSENQTFAVVHAGWRGALAGIGGKTVITMSEHFGSRPENLKVGIGPCLCTENLEVGPEVAEMVTPVDAQAVISGWEKPHLDLRGLIRRNLESVGVASDSIETMEICPFERNELFFSHRAQKGTAGRFGIVAWRS